MLPNIEVWVFSNKVGNGLVVSEGKGLVSQQTPATPAKMYLNQNAAIHVTDGRTTYSDYIFQMRRGKRDLEWNEEGGYSDSKHTCGYI